MLLQFEKIGAFSVDAEWYEAHVCMSIIENLCFLCSVTTTSNNYKGCSMTNTSVLLLWHFCLMTMLQHLAIQLNLRRTKCFYTVTIGKDRIFFSWNYGAEWYEVMCVWAKLKALASCVVQQQLVTSIKVAAQCSKRQWWQCCKNAN